ncbi:MAG: histidine kinase [Kineosporiaceae bacterium]
MSATWGQTLALVAVLAAAAGAAGAAWFLARRGELGTSAERATFATLHTASLAAPHLREGLTPAGAARAARHLRTLLGTPSIAITDAVATLAWDGEHSHHASSAARVAAGVLRSGRTAVMGERDVACEEPGCPVRAAVAAAIVAQDRVVGAIVAFGPAVTAGLVRATAEVASWVSTQVELADLDRSRTRAIEAELRALRAQISPHFVYNCLATIASFVRTDPVRARELLLDFADFTRYAFRRGGDYTTLADELRNVERYLVLEQARFGERLQTRIRIAPEVLQVAVPFLCVQPLVENAVRHGLEQASRGEESEPGHVTLCAEDAGAEALIWVEDDGAGADPEVIRAILSGQSSADSVGLGNVDARLRQVFGDDHGLVVETAPGAGTKVSFRVPKFAPGVRAR